MPALAPLALAALVLPALLTTPALTSPARAGDADAGLMVRHADELGPSYVIDSVVYSVGSQIVGNRTDFATKRADRRTPSEGPRATVLAGARELTVQAVLRGRGMGHFAYLNNYRIVVMGTCPVDMLSGMTTTVDVVITRDAGLLAEFEDGLGIDCRAIGVE